MKRHNHKIRLNYYTLLIDWDNDGNYSPEFGDWNKSVVKQERSDEYSGETFKIKVTLESLQILTGTQILMDNAKRISGCI